jgi:tetratricopeptide (TPR) repeat protein
MTLASLHLEAGDPAEALAVLRASSVSLRDPLGPQLAVLQARAHEDAGELAEAEALYLQVADEAALDFQQVEALQDAARMRMAQDNAAGAIELYERILDEIDLSDEGRGEIQLRLAEARTRAGR